MSRTNNSIRNIKYAFVGQVAGFLISFLARMVFVRTLSAEYLGLNGLFSNILSMLSFAELGVGAAIVYSLYKPLAEKDNTKVSALMCLYRKAYTTIGIVVAILGLTITPFLGYLVDEMPDIPYIHLIFMMFVLNSAISYFFSYKRSLIIADQNRYIATLYRYSCFFGLNVIQIITLLITHNYIFYLLLQIANTIIENILVSKKADKLYPFLKTEHNTHLDNEEKSTIAKNVKAMMGHKLGGIIVLGTDNLLIAKFIGIVAVGVYSNYVLITNALNTAFGLIFQSITASVGNLGATESNEKAITVFNCINLFGFWIYSFAAICLFNLFNPFIKIWLGSEYLFSIPIVAIIVFNFYLEGMRKCVLTFRDAYGLYWYDRFKPFFAAIINIIASILLVRELGVLGVFIGTAISTISTCFWVEPYVLYKYVFKCSAKIYFLEYLLRTLLFFVAGFITWFICSFISGETFIDFGIRLIINIILPNIIYLVVFYRSSEFRHIFGIVSNQCSRTITIGRENY